MLDLVNNSFSFDSIVKVDDNGKKYIEVPVEVKDEDSKQKVTVFRKLRNEVAVETVSKLYTFLNLSKATIKGSVLGMATLTKENAESVGLKSVKALIKAIFKEYSDNTIDKYIRIGRIFGNDDKSNWREEIEPTTSVSNLDVVLTLFDGKDKECETLAEYKALFDDFYTKYIDTEKIHLWKSQKALKEEVSNILHPAIDGTFKDVTETSAETSAENKKESPKESATALIQALTVIFKSNKNAKKALAILVEECNKL